MGKLIVSIHQPNFMPWLGYFYKISQSDHFVFLDDVQIQKTGSSYVNRTSILINGHSHYLSIPLVRSKGYVTIKDCLISDVNFHQKFIKIISASYAKSPYYKSYIDILIDCLSYKAECLSEFNFYFIKRICALLEISTQFHFSSNFRVVSTSTERLVDIVKNVGGTHYLSGVGGDKYQDVGTFNSAGIDLLRVSYPDFEYFQRGSSAFVRGLSIIDALFFIGADELRGKYLSKMKY